MPTPLIEQIQELASTLCVIKALPGKAHVLKCSNTELRKTYHIKLNTTNRNNQWYMLAFKEKCFQLRL